MFNLMLTIGMVAWLGQCWQALGQTPFRSELTLQESLAMARSSWQPLKADSVNILAALRDVQAHPIPDPAALHSEWGQINSAYRDQGIQINQIFRLPGVYKAQRSIAQVKLEGARIVQWRSLNSLERDLVSTYYAYVVLKRKCQLLQRNDSLLSETVKVLRLRHQQGQISGSDLNQVLLMQRESSVNVQKVYREFQTTLLWFQFLTASQQVPRSADSVLWTEGLSLIQETSSSPDLALLENLATEAMATSKLSKELRKPGWSIGLRNMSIQGLGPNGVLYPLSRRFNTFQFGLVLPLWGRPLKEKALADRFRSEAMAMSHRHGTAYLKAMQRQTLLEVTDLQDQWRQYNDTLIPLADRLTIQANAQLASGELDLILWTHTLQRILQTRESHLQLAVDLNNALIRLRYPAFNY
jgi:hypothetical protein